VFTVGEEKVRTEIAIRGIKSDKEQQQASSYKLQAATRNRSSHQQHCAREFRSGAGTAAASRPFSPALQLV